jgi:hypothetical protein
MSKLLGFQAIEEMLKKKKRKNDGASCSNNRFMNAEDL